MNKLNPGYAQQSGFSFMQRLSQAYRLLNILSIDVAVGAVVGAMFFAKIFTVSVRPQALICLGLSVWIIYTVDHLLDASNLDKVASTERHRFHQKYFNLLLFMLAAAVLIDAVLLVFIRKIVFVDGLWLAGVVIVYFLSQQSLKFMKEITGAILYSGGVLLIPWSINTSGVTAVQWILVTQFFLTALINLLLFSWFDKKQDEQDRHTSFATVMGERVTKNLLLVLFFIQVILSGASLLSAQEKSPLVLIVMNAMLLLIFVQKKYFELNDRFRLLGDAIFLMPILYVLS